MCLLPDQAGGDGDVYMKVSTLSGCGADRLIDPSGGLSSVKHKILPREYAPHSHVQGDDERLSRTRQDMMVKSILFVDFNTKHKCVDFDALKDWVVQHQAPVGLQVDYRVGDTMLETTP